MNGCLYQERRVDEVCSRICARFCIFRPRNCGNTHGDGAGRNVTDDDGIRANGRIVADRDGPQNLGACAEHDVAPDGGVPFRLAQCPPAQCDSLVYEDVVAYFGGFTHYDACSVVDEQSSSDCGPGVNFDSCEGL